jgi:hypothetical protein
MASTPFEGEYGRATSSSYFKKGIMAGHDGAGYMVRFLIGVKSVPNEGKQELAREMKIHQHRGVRTRCHASVARFRAHETGTQKANEPTEGVIVWLKRARSRFSRAVCWHKGRIRLPEGFVLPKTHRGFSSGDPSVSGPSR